MKKFPVLISGIDGSCKRSLTMGQIEVLFVIAAKQVIIHHKRSTFDLQMTFYGQVDVADGDRVYNKAVTVIKLPNGYLPKFTLVKS